MNILLAYKKEFNEVNELVNNKNELYQKVNIDINKGKQDLERAKKKENPFFKKTSLPSLSINDIDKLWYFTLENMKSKSRSEILLNIKTIQNIKALTENDPSFKLKKPIRNLEFMQKTLVDLFCFDPTPLVHQ